MEKLTMHQAEATMMKAAWGRQAVVVPRRMAGNLYCYAVTDHGEHWLPLQASWVGGRQVFEPMGTTWPERKRKTWADAVLDASNLAMAYFVQQGNSAALKRVPRASDMAEARNRTPLGDAPDTALMPSQRRGGMYDPVLDGEVKGNLLPFHEAGSLRHRWLSDRFLPSPRFCDILYRVYRLYKL